MHCYEPNAHKISVPFLSLTGSQLDNFSSISLKMSQNEAEKVDFQSVLSQLRFSGNDDFEEKTASSSDSLLSESEPSSWVGIYKKYRRPLAPSSWEWRQKSRPGKHCDSHLLDFFSCIDKTQDKLGMICYHLVGLKRDEMIFKTCTNQLTFVQFHFSPWRTIRDVLLSSQRINSSMHGSNTL